MEFIERNTVAFDENLFPGLANYRIKEFFPEISHHLLQIIVYNITLQKSIPKKQQNFLKNSTINMPPHVYHYLFVIMFSVTDLRARGMILFWVSSQPARRLFLYLHRCCCRGKSRFQRFSNEPSFPATHGLGANNSPYPWPSSHAALVSFKKTGHKGSKAQRNTKRIIIKKREDNKMIDDEVIDSELIPLLPGIGERIKKFREYRGLTTQKMAQLTNTTENTILQIESGEIPIPMPMLINFGQNLGANLNWLLTGNESMIKEKTNSYTPVMISKPEPNQLIQGEITQ
jgi:ribosome-binding protein aMBF1 (putative translation factor)